MMKSPVHLIGVLRPLLALGLCYGVPGVGGVVGVDRAEGAVVSEVLLQGTVLVGGGVGSTGNGELTLPAYVEVYSELDAGPYELVVTDVRSEPARAMAIVELGVLGLTETVLVHEGVWPDEIGLGSRRVATESLRLLEVFGGSRSLLLFNGVTGLSVGDQLHAGVTGLGAELVGSMTYRVDLSGGRLAAFPIVAGEGVVEAGAEDALRRRWVGGDYSAEAQGVDVGGVFREGGLLLLDRGASADRLVVNPGFANRPSEVTAIPESGALALWLTACVGYGFGRRRGRVR